MIFNHLSKFIITMKRSVIALSLVCLIIPCIGQEHTSIAAELERTHHALFDLHIPCFPELSKEEQELRLYYRQVLSERFLEMPSMQELLAAINNIAAMPDDVRSMTSAANPSFADLPVEEQKLVLRALRRSSNRTWRSIGKNIRFAYLISAYSCPAVHKIMLRHIGIDLPEAVIHEETLHIPPSKLNLANGIITHQSGPIDYLVIGSGPAGSVIAHELTRNLPGARIVIIESGSFVRPGSIITESSAELMESRNSRSTATGGIALRNGCAVGGGTTVNLDLAFSPLIPSIQKRLAVWSANGCLPSNFFGNDNRKLAQAYDWVMEHAHTRKVGFEEVNENNAILLQGTPYADTYYLNAKKPTGSPGEILKNSAVDAFLLPALCGGKEFAGNLSLIPDIQVDRILFDGADSTQAIGVEATFNEPIDRPYIIKDLNGFGAQQGQRVTLYAKNIIVAAGTLGSATILLKSNVKNPNIGRGIVAHPSFAFVAHFNRPINAHKGISASVYASSPSVDDGYFFEAMSADPGFLALLHPGSADQIADVLRNFNQCGGFGVMLIDSVSQYNRVYLDKNGNPQVFYQLCETDKIRLRQAIKEALYMLFEQGATEIFLPTNEPILTHKFEFVPFTSPDQVSEAVDKLEFTENEGILSSAHMQGSNKLGANPKTSVVSPNFKVWNSALGSEISNLYVVDSSVFPTSVGANPMQSIYTIAKLFADRLVQEHVTWWQRIIAIKHALHL